ncbi:MAG: ORF6N domain-containing protein [Bryobacterales bacterium]|nr:ORF6N domain-containing protein [Bryobacterales bacterium]
MPSQKVGEQIATAVSAVEGHIHVIRGQRVILDNCLASLYEVETKSINRAVKRHAERFPIDFLFQLTEIEAADLRSQIGTSRSHGGRRYLPYAFTEQGVAMLSSVLNSQRAIQVNIAIMRAFVKTRESALAHNDLVRQLNAMEKKYDSQFQVVFTAIKKLMEPIPSKPKKRIGFRES